MQLELLAGHHIPGREAPTEGHEQEAQEQDDARPAPGSVHEGAHDPPEHQRICSTTVDVDREACVRSLTMREIVDPFEQLTRSHRRLEERLAELADAAFADDPYDVVRDVAGFFSRAVARHEADEEESLFPRLVSVPALVPLMTKLGAEHREHEILHRRLGAVLRSIEEGELPSAELRDLALALSNAYRTHLEEEEKVLFPAAREALGADALGDIAREMEDRRRGGRGGA